jgi:hypothetical protein
MIEHSLAPTTHTVELEQIRAINTALSHGRRVTAQTLGLTSAVAPDSVLLALEGVGPPSYPYVFADFSGGPRNAVVRVELHTANLRAITRALSLPSQVWGV